MVLKGKAFARALKASREIPLTITGNSMPQDVILHAPADVDRVDLHEPQMVQRGSDACETGIKTCSETDEAPGCQ